MTTLPILVPMPARTSYDGRLWLRRSALEDIVMLDWPPNCASVFFDCTVIEIVIFWTALKFAARSPLHPVGLPAEKQ